MASDAPLLKVAGHSIAVLHYDTMPALADRVRAIAHHPRAREFHDRGDWHGRHSWDEAISAMQHGDARNVAASDRILADLEGKLSFESRKFETINSVVGGVPNVGAFLAGSPMNMRLRRRTESDLAPLHVVADGTVSAFFKSEQVRRRGCAVLALVRVLTNSRPVILHWMAATKHNNMSSMVLCRIETSPIELARASFLLSETAAFRRVGLSVMGTARSDLSLSPSYPLFPVGAAHEALQSILNVAPADLLYIPQMKMGDGLADDPTAWIIDKVERYGRAQEEA